MNHAAFCLLNEHFGDAFADAYFGDPFADAYDESKTQNLLEAAEQFNTTTETFSSLEAIDLRSFYNFDRNEKNEYIRSISEDTKKCLRKVFGERLYI